MSEVVTRSGESALVDSAPAAAPGSTTAVARELSLEQPRTRPVEAAETLLAARHPALFIDPRAWTVHAARSLRRRGIPVVVLAGSRLDPAVSVRGVRRQHLPPLDARPERWQAALLELAAKLEPRAAVYACTEKAAVLLDRTRRTLLPHFELPNLRGFDHPAPAVDPDAALATALARREAALEVQLVLDRGGRRTGSAVLAWASGAPPDVLVTSVAGNEVLARSEDWLGARRTAGYARLVWSPDRFGRLTLQAASTIPGPGLVLAAADGVDFTPLTHAVSFGRREPEQRPACRLVRRLAWCGSDLAALPEWSAPVRFEWRDPAPSRLAFLRSLQRT